MTDSRIDGPFSGGCQCGAVRYRLDYALDTAHICHCRMGQKASGNYFAALVATDNAALLIRASNHQHPDHDPPAWPVTKE